MPINCAHRGASGLAPENTRVALRRALALGADMAEIDVQLTADGVPVLLHDESVDRTTDGRGALAEMNLAALQLLDAGVWWALEFVGERVPTLSSVIRELGSRLPLNIELKGTAGPELERTVVQVIRDLDFADRCLLTSFDHARIDRLRVEAPDLRRGYIVARGGWQDDFLKAEVDVLSLASSEVEAARVTAAGDQGKQVHVWTVDDPAEMQRLIDLGVEAIITNRPDLFPGR